MNRAADVSLGGEYFHTACIGLRLKASELGIKAQKFYLGRSRYFCVGGKFHDVGGILLPSGWLQGEDGGRWRTVRDGLRIR